MFDHTGVTARSLLLGLIVAGALACGGEAQESQAEETLDARSSSAGEPEFRLTMPVVRKVVPVLSAVGEQAEAECPEVRESYRKGATELAKAFDRCKPVEERLDAAGLSSHESAGVTLALMRAFWHLGTEEAAAEAGQDPPPPPSSEIARANLELVRANRAEIEDLESL